ncbi:MAG: response regulator [Candidatus Odinarchaeota archaeon]
MEGTEFTILLPLKIAGKPVLSGDISTKPSPKRILVVDDHEENRDLLGILLRKENHSVSFAKNGQEAISECREKQFDLILMDLLMDVMDGYTATRLIREWEKDMGKKPVPIVALTAIALKGDLDKCLKAGCNAYIVKPFRREELISIIAKFN